MSASGANQDRTRRPSRARKALIQLAIVATLLVALELVLAAAGVEPGSAGGDPYVGFAGNRPLFQRDDSGLLRTDPEKLNLFNEQSFRDPKPDNTTRIFTLGGSTTYGRPYDDRTSFSAWLRELLPVGDPTRDYEVINAGGISYASYRVAVVMEELLAYEPDVFVIYSGHNEFLEQRHYSALAETPRPLLRLFSLLSRTRLFSVARRLVSGDRPTGSATVGAGGEPGAPAQLAGEVQTLLDNSLGPEQYTRDDELRDQVVAHFRFNLDRMVSMARDAGADVILVTPASALRDCLPFKGEDAPAGAVPAVERNARRLYEQGLALLAAGDTEGAVTALTRARDEDVCPLRAVSPIVAATREVAAARDVPLVDFVDVLADAMLARSGHTLPGAEWFLDHVHPTLDGHRMLGLHIAGALRRAELWEAPPNWDPRLPAQVAPIIEARVDAEFQGFALRNLAKVLGWAGKDQEAANLARRSQELLGSGDAETWFLLGTFASADVRLDEAVQHYRAAVAIDPGYAEAWFNLGQALLVTGPLDEAGTAADKARQLMPDAARAHLLVGLVASRRGLHAEAEQALARALALGEDSAALHNNLGLAQLRQDRASEARRSFERAIARDPDYAKGHYNLALLLMAAGDLDAAAGHLERALQSAPDYTAARHKLAEVRERQQAGG